MFLSRKWLADNKLEEEIIASMGPGCFYPGNPVGVVIEMGARTLQWGRDVSIPEIFVSNAPVLHAARLQWGRDVSIPEIY